MEREETGRIEETKGKAFLRIVGFYSYIDNNGTHYKHFYHADQEGTKFENTWIKSASFNVIQSE